MHDAQLDRLIGQMALRLRNVAAGRAFLAWTTHGLALLFLGLLAGVALYPWWPAGPVYPRLLAWLAGGGLALVLALAGAAAQAASLAHPARADPLLAAAELDRRLGLADRLSSALQLRERPDPFVRALLADARRRQPAELPVGLVPFEPPPVAALLGVLALGALLLLVVLGLTAQIPERSPARLPRTAVDAATREALRQAARRLDGTAQRMAHEAGSATREERTPVTGELSRTARRLRRPGTTAEQALQQVSQARRALDRLQQQKREGLRQAAAELGALARELGRDRLTERIAQQLAAGKLKQAAGGLNELARAVGRQGLSPDEKKRLRRRLQEARKKLKSKSTRPIAQQLERAAGALGGGRDGQASAALSKLAQKLMQVQQLVRRDEELARLAEEAGLQLDWAKVKINERDKYARPQEDQAERAYRDRRRRGKPVKINPNQVRLGQQGGRGGAGEGTQGPCIGCSHRGSCLECPCRAAPKDCPTCKAPCKCPRCWVTVSLDPRKSGVAGASSSPASPQAGRGDGERRAGPGGRLGARRTPQELRAHRVGREGRTEILLIQGANDRSAAGVEYRNMVERFRRAAEQRIVKERIPLGRREYIKQYFQQIKPK